MQYDYIVIGTGSGGSVIARRLAEDLGATTLVLEAGGLDRNPWIHVPVGYVKTLNDDEVNWNFEIEAEAHTHDRTMRLPRGRVVGGSSSINGMLYVRGNRRDYDGWAQLGSRGWSYEDVLPFFKRSERAELGDSEFRGRDGPLPISRPRLRHELMDAIIEAGETLGYPANPDYNGASQEGFAYYQVTQAQGLRQSTYRTFLKPVLGQRNVTLLTHALAHRVVLENGRATGVVFERKGEMHTALARREIIVAAGSVQSPQLLELSGIGAPKVLADAGITLNHELPGVGENYRDHYIVRQSWRIRTPITLNESTRGIGLVGSSIRYVFTRSGPLSAPASLVAGFVRSRAGLEIPDVQYHIVHASYGNQASKSLEDEPGLTIGTYQLRPESTGSIHVRTPDPHTQPAIVGRYLTNDFDTGVLVAGIQIARKLMATDVMRPYVAHETAPGADVDTPAAIADHAHRAGMAIYHPVGTCKMGNDPMAVVDDRLRVHGIRGLRVADASVMPTMTSGNTHAPTMMIAERCAAFIREDHE